jgi:hypothetical protein
MAACGLLHDCHHGDAFNVRMQNDETQTSVKHILLVMALMSVTGGRVNRDS